MGVKKPRATFHDKKGAQARRLFDDGLSCSMIAVQLKVSKATVSRWAAREGLRFDRAQIAEATRAKQIDLADARMDLAYRMYEAAGSMLDMLDKPFTVYNFGGKDNTFASEDLANPPVDARRTIITASAIVFDKLTRIVERSTEDEDALGRSVVSDLMAGLRIIHKDNQQPTSDEP